MPTPMPPGFVLLHTKELSSPIYMAIDEISRFSPEDPYRDGGPSLVVTSDSGRIKVRESTDAIAQLIVDATTTFEVNDDA